MVSRDDIHGPRIDTVSNDDVAGAELAVRHLIGLGHERITHLSGGDNPAARGTRGRLPGRDDVPPGSPATSASCRAGSPTPPATPRRVTALADTPHPTALFVANDIAALGAIAAVQETGRAVPRDVSVVGYDGIALGALRTLSLTTVAQPLSRHGLTGRAAAVRVASTDPANALSTSAWSRQLVVRGIHRSAASPLGARPRWTLPTRRTSRAPQGWPRPRCRAPHGR